MKRPLLILFLLVFVLKIHLNGQDIVGVVVDSINGDPISYVNIGLVGISKGTISDEQGRFHLAIDELSLDSEVKFSMIGYTPRSFFLKELTRGENLVKLQFQTIELKEVVVRPQGPLKILGTKKSSIAIVCGWGGTDYSKGHEIGTLINLGEKTVAVKSFNFRVYKQSFDTIMFRLHIRSLKDSLPHMELLQENIYITVFEVKGWQQIDLSAYNLFFKGEIVVSLEWIRISGVNQKNLIRVNRKKKPYANVLFNLNRKAGTFYMRRGSEAKWKIFENQSPAFYLEIQE